MPLGPGRYDDLCTLVREQTHARGAAVLVFGGDKGDGFAMQADAITTLKLPEILETMAQQIRESLDRGEP